MLKQTLTAAAVLCVLYGCSHSSHTVVTGDGSTVTVSKDKDGGSAVHVNKDGDSVDINSGKPITDYPSDTPLYAGVSKMDVKAEQKHSRETIVQSPDSMAKIADFYKTELPNKGWKIDTDMNTDKMVMYTASKDNRELVVQVGAGNDGKQVISQTVSDK